MTSPRDPRVLDRLKTAIERTPNPSTRTLMKATGISSTSQVARHLRHLAARGEVVLRSGPYGLEVDTGRDFAAAWDAAARLAGNEEA